jgi:hypothetical protein
MQSTFSPACNSIYLHRRHLTIYFNAFVLLNSLCGFPCMFHQMVAFRNKKSVASSKKISLQRVLMLHATFALRNLLQHSDILNATSGNSFNNISKCSLQYKKLLKNKCFRLHYSCKNVMSHNILNTTKTIIKHQMATNEHLKLLHATY